MDGLTVYPRELAEQEMALFPMRLYQAYLPALFIGCILLCAGCLDRGDALEAAALDGAKVADQSQPPERPEPEPPPPPASFTMVAVGDVMLDRWVGQVIERRGAAHILEKVRDDLRTADIAFANLESPLSTVGAHAPKACIFRADPAAVEVLLDGGFNIVSIANNHTLDAGVPGLMQTMDHLEAAGIAWCGAARERERSWEPTRFEIGGLTLGFVACTDLSFQHGSWCKVDAEMTEFAEHIRAAKSQCDLLVVSIHWGNEYQNVPTRRQREVAHAAIDAGADLIIGHHPHVLQGVGAYRGAPILYSTGNFVFDQREGERMESAIFHLRYTEGEGWHIRMVPVWIPFARAGPIYPEPSRAKRIIERLASLSENLGVPVEVRDNEGETIIAPELRRLRSPSQVRSDILQRPRPPE